MHNVNQSETGEVFFINFFSITVILVVTYNYIQ